MGSEVVDKWMAGRVDGLGWGLTWVGHLVISVGKCLDAAGLAR